MGNEEVCIPLTSDGGVVKDESPSRTEQKRDSEWVGDLTEAEPCTKKLAVEAINDTESCANKLVKEASNEDICSEVSNPHLSPRDNDGSFHTISSQPHNELVSNNPIGSSENSSTCSGNSSSEGTLSDEEASQNDASGAESTSHFVLEIPKHVSSSGVRKITFRFSKPKEENQEIDNQCANYGISDSLYNVPAWPYSAPVNNNAEISTSMKMVDEKSKPFSYQSNRELKMSKKVLPEIYPTNVKKLLATGILDGARVNYIYAPLERELPGIIDGGGYLCGCVLCNFSVILSAFEFEMHAGAKTRHPNNHIYLENGKPIYSIIQELKNAPLDAVDEVIRSVAGSSLNNESFLDWKANLERDSVTIKEEGSDYAMVPRMYHSSTSGQVNEDNVCYTSYPPIFPVRKQSYMLEASKGRKRVAKKKKIHSSPVLHQRKTAGGGTRKRDNDLHRLLFMPDGLPDRTELAYYSKGQRILEGYKQGNGIVCSCCHTEISPSQFEAHAGWSARRQPYRNIYTSSGLTLHDIALLLANGQNLAASSSDDMCAVCGDGSDLIICDGCPRAFHVDCLNLQSAPEGDWHCPYCVDKLYLGRKSAGELSCSGRPFVIRLTRVVKSPESEAGGCVVCRANDFSVAKFDERTVMLCDQCEKEYHVGCLRNSGLCDLKELPKDKWFCRDECNRIHVGLQDLVLAGVQTVPASVSIAINRRHIVNEFSDGAVDDVQWRILSGKSRYPDHLPVLSRATAIFRECFDPIVATSGRDLIPVMVYGRNISGQEFGGMYCVVLIVKSVVVSAGLVRIFGREVAELPIVATSRENQGKGYFLALFSCIERLLSTLNVETLVLPAAGDAESIWTNRLGFRKMNDERLSKYTRDFQLTSFKGTSMLEKEVQRTEDGED